MKFFDFVRKFAVVRFYAIMILVGLLFSIVGGILFLRPNDNLATVEASIIDVGEEQIGSDDTFLFAVVEYEVNGTTYTGQVGRSTSDKIGDKITIEYNINNPEEISNKGSDIVTIVFIVVGLALVVIGIVFLVKNIKRSSEDYNQLDRVDKDSVSEEVIKEIEESDEPMIDYYFHWCKKLNQSYVLETLSRTPVYEADCDRIGVFKPYIYTFTNHRTGRRFTSEVTHTITTSTGTSQMIGSGLTSISIPTSSSFKIDKVSIWDYLGEKGYSLEPHLQGIKLNFDVLHYGVKVAYLEAAGVNAVKDGNSKLGDKLPANGVYKVKCRESDLDGVFMACFAVSRVEFF